MRVSTFGGGGQKPFFSSGSERSQAVLASPSGRNTFEKG
jgi:hypothetical protein